MDSATEITNNASKESIGFIKYVFNTDEDSKCEMMNMVQYVLLAIIPAILILKAVRVAVPEEDDSKGSIEIVAECLAQIAFIVLAIYFSDKAIRYVPTYSKCDYVKGNILSFLLPFVVLMLTMQTKLGAKINILLDRVMELWHGKSEDAVNVKSGNVKSTQPLAGQHQPSQADTRMDNMQLLPSTPGMTGLPTGVIPPQQSPDFNQMYQSAPTPMVNAHTPGQENMMGMMDQGPIAANEIGGFGGFSSW